MKGRLITFEGPEGSGKSTQIARVVAALEAQGIDVLSTREPGGTATGDMIRDILQHDVSGEPIHPEAELLLFAASRAQLVGQRLLPALARGTWVVCDRFIDSTTAYQGEGRGFERDDVRRINHFATGGLIPDLTLLLDIDVAAGARRMAARNRDTGQGDDRFERESRAYHEQVRAAYLAIARECPERVRVVDAQRSIDDVHADIWNCVAPFLKDPHESE